MPITPIVNDVFAPFVCNLQLPRKKKKSGIWRFRDYIDVRIHGDIVPPFFMYYGKIYGSPTVTSSIANLDWGTTNVNQTVATYRYTRQGKA